MISSEVVVLSSSLLVGVGALATALPVGDFGATGVLSTTAYFLRAALARSKTAVAAVTAALSFLGPSVAIGDDFLTVGEGGDFFMVAPVEVALFESTLTLTLLGATLWVSVTTDTAC